MEGFTVLAIAKRSAFGFVCGSSTKKDIGFMSNTFKVPTADCDILKLQPQTTIVAFFFACFMFSVCFIC